MFICTYVYISRSRVGHTAAAVALAVQATFPLQARRRAAPGPTVATVALTVRAAPLQQQDQIINLQTKMHNLAINRRSHTH